MENNTVVPMLFPYEPIEFWTKIREIVREEISKNKNEMITSSNIMETQGLTEKPLYKIQEICSLFKVTKPTVYDWIKHGKLKKIKIRSRVYFLGSDIKLLMQY
jgi:excisionase family DNA binding protein